MDIKMPWVRFIFNEVNLVTLVRCHDHTQIDIQKKVLVAKWDYTYKHVSKKKVFYGNWNMDPKCGHAKTEIVMFNYQQQLSSNIFNPGHTKENKQKLIQFATIFN